MTNLIHGYFKWLKSLICYGQYESYSSDYDELLLYLFNADFYWSNPRDENRYEDGGDLRDLYLDEMINEIDPIAYDDLVLYFDDAPVNVLEVMVALAKRMEDQIMEDENFGNRTSEWFWNMITSLGLIEMTNDRYNKTYISKVMDKFLNVEYDPDGKGGLFYLQNYEGDLRELEIWYQMNQYLDYILDM